MKIAIIGTGNLGLSIAKGLVINNTYTTLYLTKRNLDSLSSWKEYKNVFITQDNKEAVQNSDIIIFAVQPNQFDLIIDDVFWDDIIPTFCMSEQYLQAVQRILSSEGVYWRNTMANDQSDNYQQRYEQHFPKVHFLTHKQYGNKLYFCQKSCYKCIQFLRMMLQLF